MMKTRQRLASASTACIAVMGCVMGCAPAYAGDVQVSADTYVTSAESPSNLQAVNYGSSVNLNLGAGAQALVQFDLSALPASVAKATLVLFANRVTIAGEADVYSLAGPWTEPGVSFIGGTSPTATNPLPPRGAYLGTLALNTSAAFYALDVTAQVNAWLASPAANYGLLVAPSPDSGLSATIDSKENISTSHPAYLSVMLSGPPGLTGATGPPGAGFAYRNAWSPTTGYNINDVVTLNGSSYVALAGNTGVNPATGPTGQWALFAGGAPNAAWGNVAGTLSNQTDLWNALGAKLAASANLGDLASAPAARANLGLGTAATQPSTAFEPAITPGTGGQYWAGDKTWQPFNLSSTSSLLAIGTNANNLWPGEVGTVSNNVAIGPGAYNLYSGVGVGGGTNSVNDSVALGANAGNSLTFGLDGAATQSVAIGSGSTNSWICGTYANSGQVAVGYQANSGCWNAIAIGANSSNWGADSISIGRNTINRSIDSIIMGAAANDNGFAGFAAGNHAVLYDHGQIVFGGDQQAQFGGLSDLYIGPPVTNFALGNQTNMSVNPCGGGRGIYETGSGANIPGCTLSINGGRGSGSGAGGTLFFKTAPAGPSGTTQNALVTRMSIDAGGNIRIPSFGAGWLQASSNGTLSSGVLSAAAPLVFNSSSGQFSCPTCLAGAPATIGISSAAPGGATYTLNAGDGTTTPAGGFSIAGSGGNRLTIDSGGNIGIGTTPAGSYLLQLRQGGGSAVADGWVTYSSQRYKNNIRTLPDALQKVERLRGVSYSLDATGRSEIGVIAEEVGAVLPEIVTWEPNGRDARGVDYTRLSAVLIEAVKAQQEEIRHLKSQVEELQDVQHRLAAIESRLAAR